MTTKVFHIALTALDAEAQDPVAWRFWPEDDPTIWFIVDSVKDPAHSPGEVGSDGRRWLSSPLYTIPPAQPVEVPDVSELEKVLRFIEGLPVPTSGAAINGKRLHDFIAACRASMLATPVVSGWIACSERMPAESGRYWCYVEEQNSLGKSHYQWNCSWNGDVWSDKALTGRVTHWMPLPAAPQEPTK
ncbi:DUF551 domain-containing protein [Cronobacter sakazakii]|nr:DUF551 domain-containing protein [Cronobacter sakazakii]